MTHFVRADTIDPSALAELLERSRRPDGEQALSEHKMERVTGSIDSRSLVGMGGDGRAVSYGQAAWHRAPASGDAGHWAIELALSAEARSHDDVVGLVTELLAMLPQRDRVAVWSFDQLVSEALGLVGYQPTREMFRLSRRLPLDIGAAVPVGIRIEPFAYDRDAKDWLAVNNLAFAGHPENGALGSDDLLARMSLDWFDPDGFLVALEGERLAGSCWTKMHEGHIGEIYIIAVHPDSQGRGIGRSLLGEAAVHLHERRGATTLMLYAEGDNEAGLGLYEALGFQVESVSRQFESAQA